jgi:uncharacterized protein
MKLAEARIATDRGSIYLQQLCKHFAHRLPVEFTPQQGQITFSVGTCRLQADATTLTLHAEAADDAQLAQLEDVVARHLVRFAFREPPAIVWEPKQ